MPAAPAETPITLYRLSVAEYHAVAKAGILAAGDAGRRGPKTHERVNVLNVIKPYTGIANGASAAVSAKLTAVRGGKHVQNVHTFIVGADRADRGTVASEADEN